MHIKAWMLAMFGYTEDAKVVSTSEQDLVHKGLTVRHADPESRRQWNKMPVDETQKPEVNRGSSSG